MFLPCFRCWSSHYLFQGLAPSPPLLALGYVLRVHKTRQCNTVCWKLNLISGFFAFSRLFGQVESINVAGVPGWCLARGKGCWLMGPAPDPKCKLNISSFLALPHLWDCLICTGNSVSIPFFLEMVGGWDRWGRTGGGYYVVVFAFFISLVLLLFLISCPLSLCLKRLEHDSCCFCSLVFYFFSFSLVPLSRSYWSTDIAVSVM